MMKITQNILFPFLNRNTCQAILKSRSSIKEMQQLSKPSVQFYSTYTKDALSSCSDKRPDSKDYLHTVNCIPHRTALPNHYDMCAKNDEYFNSEDSALPMNSAVATLLQSHHPNCRSVLDVTCGAGSQFFYLAQRGYDVTGSDINVKMLEVARNKALKLSLGLQNRFHVADMRSVQLGKFDAVISIFNAVGHLTREDFERAMLNVKSNLIKDGIYIFDIYNAEYLRNESNIAKLTIDFIKRKPSGDIIRKVQYSDIDKDGVLASHTTSYEDNPRGQRTVSRSVQTLQVYTAEELVEMLNRSGFNVLEQCGIDRTKFSATETERIFTTAQLK